MARTWVIVYRERAVVPGCSMLSEVSRTFVDVDSMRDAIRATVGAAAEDWPVSSSTRRELVLHDPHSDVRVRATTGSRVAVRRK